MARQTSKTPDAFAGNECFTFACSFFLDFPILPAMGCLESCFKKEEGEPDERSPLLQDGCNPNGNSMPVNTPTIHQVLLRVSKKI